MVRAVAAQALLVADVREGRLADALLRGLDEVNQQRLDQPHHVGFIDKSRPGIRGT